MYEGLTVTKSQLLVIGVLVMSGVLALSFVLFWVVWEFVRHWSWV